MKSIIKISIFALFLIVLCMGCSSAPVKLVVMDQQSDRSQFDFTKPRQLSSTASGFQLLLWIPIAINSRQEVAYNDLMAQAGTDYVTDFKIQESWRYAFIGTIYQTTIEATAYPRYQDTSGNQPPSGMDDIPSQLKKLKDLHDSDILTDEEYEMKRKSLTDKL